MTQAQKFQAGDRVRCIQPISFGEAYFNLTTDSVYTITDVSRWGSVSLAEAAPSPINGKPLYFSPTRFLPVNEPLVFPKIDLAVPGTTYIVGSGLPEQDCPCGACTQFDAATKIAPLDVGARVEFSLDYRFYDKGDQGTILDSDGDTFTVELDGGAVVEDVLVAEQGDYRVMLDGAVWETSYATEASAAEAAEDLGYTAFQVVKLAVVATYEVQTRTELVKVAA
jgi:hypothetical protein